MKYNEFERIVSQKRINRYVLAYGGNTRKAMILYRYNIELSQVMFAIICHFEVALRNAIDAILTTRFGGEWLKDSLQPGGLFDTPATKRDFDNVQHAFNKLQEQNLYSHSKLLASMEFGFWKYQFAPAQYAQTDKKLMKVFPNKTRSTAKRKYNISYIFNELDKINTLRNRIAHHEPICFSVKTPIIYTDYILNEYANITMLFRWMGIDSKDLLFGLDHVKQICMKINKLKANIKQYPPV